MKTSGCFPSVVDGVAIPDDSSLGGSQAVRDPGRTSALAGQHPHGFDSFGAGGVDGPALKEPDDGHGVDAGVADGLLAPDTTDASVAAE